MARKRCTPTAQPFRPTADATEVPVEMLTIGLLNAIGDGLGVLADGGRSVSRAVLPKSPKDGPGSDHLPVTAPEHAAYMGGKVVHGVQEIGNGGMGMARGARDIALGGLELVTGTIGCMAAGALVVGTLVTDGIASLGNGNKEKERS